jgi:hypothetical protein
MSNFLREGHFLKRQDRCRDRLRSSNVQDNHNDWGQSQALMAEDSRVSLQRILYRQMPCRDASLYDEVFVFSISAFPDKPFVTFDIRICWNLKVSDHDAYIMKECRIVFSDEFANEKLSSFK